MAGIAPYAKTVVADMPKPTRSGLREHRDPHLQLCRDHSRSRWQAQTCDREVDSFYAKEGGRWMLVHANLRPFNCPLVGPF